MNVRFFLLQWNPHNFNGLMQIEWEFYFHITRLDKIAKKILSKFIWNVLIKHFL